MNDQLFQTFRCRSTGEEIDIPVQKGAAPNELFVLWSDIQSGFKNAESVRNGRALIPFIKDRNNCEVEPRGIGYYPGITLEVITGSNTQSSSTHVVVDATKATAEGIGRDPVNAFYSQSCTEISIETGSVAPYTATLSIANMDADDQALVKYSEGLPADPRSSNRTSNHPYTTHMQTITSEHRMQTTNIKQSPAQLLLDMARNGVVQTQLIQELLQRQEQSHEELLEKLRQMEQSLEQKQQETLELQRKLDERHELIFQMQQSAKEELLKKQEEMLNLQKQTLNRLAVILNHVKALLTQTYELHEYPIPRLFIVLPISTGLRDKFNPFSEKYRLYFLCECGTHTMADGSKIPHEVHLAKHEGYDLERSKEFFEKYGSYINAMMCMIKYGIIAGSIVVPPLASLKVPDLPGSAEKDMDYLKRNIAPLVNDTIDLLQDLERNSKLVGGLATENRGFDRLEALEGVDLRQLESYLKVKDRGRVLGNLYRIVTPEGHVKWVCLDHYRANYRESAMKDLREAVQSNVGTFIEDTGRIEIEIANSVLAGQFYEAMVKARGTHELKIKLAWETTMDDLRDLCDAVTKANVIRLTVDGEFFKSSPAIDYINRGRRFDPILKLASNARLRSLELIGFDDFFSRVTKYTQLSPKLRIFAMEWKTPLDEKAVKLFNGFLEQCSGLTTLELKVHQQYPTTKALMGTFTKVCELKSLTVDYGRFSVTTSFIQGKIQDAGITSSELSSITFEDLDFICQAPFTQLAIESVPSSDVRDKIADVLRQSQGLTHLRIGGKMNSDAGLRSEMMLQDLMELFALTTNSRLESLTIDYGRFTLAAYFSKGSKDMTMRFEQLDDLTPDDLKFIQQGPYDRLRIEHTWERNERQLADILRQNSALNYHQSKCHGERRVTVATVADMRLQDLVNLATSETSSKLESFSVGCQRIALTADFLQGDIQSMTMTIEQLNNLTSDDLALISQGCLTQLTIKSAPLPQNEDRLSSILRHCPELRRLHVKFKEEWNLSGAAKLDMKFQDVMGMVILDTLTKLESFKIDYRKISTAANISHGRIENVAITIERFGDLTPDYIQFIQENRLTKLVVITHTPQKADESRLTEVLRQCPLLTHLQVGSYWKRSLAIVNLVLSTREKIIAQGGSFSLRTFELMDQDLAPFDMLASRDKKTHIQSHLSFPKDSNSFEMRTWIRLKWDMSGAGSVRDFIRQYGWSIVFFDGYLVDRNVLMTSNKLSNTRASQLESLMVDSRDLVGEGVNLLDNIKKQSPNFQDLGMYVSTRSESELQEALSLLGHYRTILSKLQLYGYDNFSRVASSFPTRDNFPALESFEINFPALESLEINLRELVFRINPELQSSGWWPFKGAPIASKLTSWIATMVSAPPQSAASSSASERLLQDTVIDEQNTHCASESTRSWTSLKKVMLRGVELRPEEWKRIIEALDVSALEYLDLGESNIAQEQFEMLVDRITDNNALKLPLKTVNVRRNNFTLPIDSIALDVARLKKRAPLVRIILDP
ncbi:MAG: hypothetical protein J3Q66DRAFT_418261 [Benniella sp.]|nr:MAG: hypothetical protein J3Q66DRAFT_418261 [Benniella sp.]